MLSLPRRRGRRPTRYAIRYAVSRFVTAWRHGFVTAVTPSEAPRDVDKGCAIAASLAAQSAAGLTW
jgi:hypothetical protein